MSFIKPENITNLKILEFDWKVFAQKVKIMIDYVSETTVLPINADRWEEIIHTVFKNMGYESYWNPGSHLPGADIYTKDFSISAKSGRVEKNSLVISSYRLTRFYTIEEMISFIDGKEGKNFDIYLCCARKDYKIYRNYQIYMVDVNVFKAADLNWKNFQDQNKWVGTNEIGIRFEIRKKMSNQLWMNIPLNMCNELVNITMLKSNIGSKADWPLR